MRPADEANLIRLRVGAIKRHGGFRGLTGSPKICLNTYATGGEAAGQHHGLNKDSLQGPVLGIESGPEESGVCL